MGGSREVREGREVLVGEVIAKVVIIDRVDRVGRVDCGGVFRGVMGNGIW